MKSALFVRGGWEGHEPEQRARIFAPFLEENGYEAEVSTTPDSYGDYHRRAGARFDPRSREWDWARGLARWHGRLDRKATGFRFFAFPET